MRAADLVWLATTVLAGSVAVGAIVMVEIVDAEAQQQRKRAQTAELALIDARAEAEALQGSVRQCAATFTRLRQDGALAAYGLEPVREAQR